MCSMLICERSPIQTNQDPSADAFSILSVLSAGSTAAAAGQGQPRARDAGQDGGCWPDAPLQLLRGRQARPSQLVEIVDGGAVEK
jgi:hypothetical protein